MQYLHFRAGTSELRAPAVCWHEVGSGSPACPHFCAQLGPSAWHREQEKEGQWEFAPWEGEASTAAAVTLAGAGQIQPS